MTGLDLLVAAMFQTCVDYQPVITQEKNPRVEVQLYECPLMGAEAKFLVWRRVCSADEKHTIIVRDTRNGKGWVINQFLDIGTAYVDTEGIDPYGPRCQTEDIAGAK